MTDVHETAVIGPGVRIGDDVIVGPQVTITGPCTVGDSTWIGPGSRIGGPPEISSLRQNAAWNGDLDHSGVTIGAHVVIRENVVIHQGSRRATTVHDGAWLLNSCYLAHDVQIGEAATISAGVSIGGHAEIGAQANIGMNAAIHQGRRVGSGAMVGMSTPVSRDVPPFSKVYGVPPRLVAMNLHVLDKLGVPGHLAEVLLDHYRTPGSPPPWDDAPEWSAIISDLRWWEDHDELRPVRHESARLAAN